MSGRPALFRSCPRAREAGAGSGGSEPAGDGCPSPPGTTGPLASVCPLGSACALANEPPLSDEVLAALERAARRKARVWGVAEDELQSDGYVWLAEGDGRVLRSFQGRASLETYIGAVLEKRLIDQERKRSGRRKRRTFVDVAGLEGLRATTRDPEGDLLAREAERRAERLMVALEALPEEERLAARWRHVEGLSPREIARLLDATPFAVYSLLRAARRKLALALTGAAAAFRDGLRHEPAGRSD